MTESGVFRLLDANLNRAAEGLRTLEDYWRFLRDDPAAAAAAKNARHAVQAMRARLDAVADANAAGGMSPAPGASAGLAAYRDTPGDVGREIKTEGEARRDDAARVARAALGRATQALRVIGEFAKGLDAGVAAEAEAWRYRLYAWEARLGGGAQRRARLARGGAWRWIDAPPCEWAELFARGRSEAEGRNPESRGAEACEAEASGRDESGASGAMGEGDPEAGWIFRAGGAAEGELFAAMREVRRLADAPSFSFSPNNPPPTSSSPSTPFSPLLILDGPPSLAAMSDWDGALWREGSLPPTWMRRLLGGARLLMSLEGVSPPEPALIDGRIAIKN